MKNIFVNGIDCENLKILSFDIEDISKNAHWGKGLRHDTIIHYVLSGEGYFNNKKVKRGQGFVILKNTLTEYHSSKTNPWTYFWVIINGTEDIKTINKYISYDENGIFDYNFTDELTNFTKSFFNKHNNISHIKALGTFMLLLSYHQSTEKTNANKYVTEAEKYIEQNCYRSITVSEIAKTLHISDRYLYNLFIKHKKISPKQYLNSIRLEKACLMLKSGTNTVTEVALSVGFPDVLTFSRFFSKHMKVWDVKIYIPFLYHCFSLIKCLPVIPVIPCNMRHFMKICKTLHFIT